MAVARRLAVTAVSAAVVVAVVLGGSGGFGGGGGGGSFPSGGHGGFGGGNGAEGVGGGGLGAGGDIFVQQGGQLTIEGGSLSGGAVAGGAGGAIAGNQAATAHAGSAYGSGIFIQGNQTITFAPALHQTVTISDVIADQSGSGGTGSNAGTGNVLIDGAGTVVYSAHETYSGLTTIEQGTLKLASGGLLSSHSGLDLSASDATFDMSAAGNQTVGDFSGVAGSEVQLGANALTVGGSASTNFGGTILGSDGSLIKQGSGTLTLSGHNSYSGGTILEQGTLEVQSADAVGSGGITFAANTADTLAIDNTALAGNVFGSTISGFALGGDSIDLTGLRWDATDHNAGFANGTLSIESGGITDVLTLAGNYTADQFVLSEDGGGGTMVSLVDEVSSESALNGAIAAIDAAGPGNYVIRLTADITLGSDLTAINLKSGVSLTIEGNGFAIDGQHSQHGFFVYQGNVTLEDLTIENTVAKGGAGASGGGGGAGLGGGLFIAGTSTTSSGAGGHVTLSDVSFLNDAAVGGAGGAAGGSGLGGGGGLGGAGGAGENQNLPAENGGGGGGGIGDAASGGSRAASGATGIVTGETGGGAGGIYVTVGSAHFGAGGANGGGGGGGFNAGGGGGGIGGFAGSNGSGGYGGPGGFGGGGGGSQFVNGSGGSGGFGGGGGAGAWFGGWGGFGGGGGGGDSSGGGGGFGAGNGAAGNASKLTHGGGGGGLGAGGDIFIQQGGSLTIEGGSLTGGSATGGSGAGTAGGGAGYGSGIFIQGDQSITFAPAAGQTETVSDVIADMSGTNDPSGETGAGSLIMDGAGTLVLAADNRPGSSSEADLAGFTGGITLKSGTLVLAATGAAGSGAITFSPPSAGDPTLEFTPATAPSNLIENFGAGDDIQIDGFVETSGTYWHDILTLHGTDAGGHSTTVTLDMPGLAASNFAVAVAAGTTTISYATAQTEIVACYARGTLISTGAGEVAVEDLAIGDRVTTASGALRAIKWIGKRAYGGRFVIGRRDILPIRIKAGALDENIPRRDLSVSPHHAMYFDGVLIEARDLVNDVSIVQAVRIDEVEYFHIELDTHDIIVAEGALSETFVDDHSRGMFHNVHEYRALYPTATPPVRVSYCAPRLREGYEVEAVRRRIALRAGLPRAADAPGAGKLRGFVDHVGARGIEGWAQAIEYPDVPVCLDICADGKLIRQVLANRYRRDLERAGIGGGSHSFLFVPPEDIPLDRISVRRSLDGALLPMSPRARRSLRVA